MADEIVFGVLPVVIGRGDRNVMRHEFGDILPVLRAKPHEWARVKTLGAGHQAKLRSTRWASVINRGTSPTFGTNYEAVTRTLGDGTVTLWMRYVGEESKKS